MFNKIFLKITSFFNEGHARTIKAKKNIAVSFVFRGLSIAIGFLLVPMTINFINPTQYGVWLILSSAIGWFNFFDIGLANGLRNKLAEAIALGEQDKARIYVSTTYAILACISTIIFLVFYIANHFVNWQSLLNAPSFTGHTLNDLTIIITGIFCLQFFVQIITTVITANHATALISKINLIGQVLILIIIWILSRNTQRSFTILVLVLAGIPVLVQLISSFWFYLNRYKLFRPNIKSVDFKYAKSLFSVGGAFFVIQIGALVLFQTDNIVIARLFEPSQVTTFNIVYKLFSAITMIFAILMAPFWSAFTEAFTKQDFSWINESIFKLRKYWLYLTIITFAVLIISPWLYKIWVPKNANIPFSISFAMAIYISCYMWMMLHCFFLNGIGKLRLQLYLYLISTIINIPIAIVLGKFLGIAGVTASNIIVLLFMGIILFVQTNKILKNKATGVWNR